jgi:biopolymer transport protein TolR
MKLSALERRAERRDRNKSGLDMNLVSLIDIFTILIFFLMSGATGVEILPSNKAVKLPDSTSEKGPRETVVVLVSGSDIVVDGRLIASVADVLRSDADLIGSLKTELDLQASRQVIRKENQDKSKALTIMGDKDIPYRLLHKVMYTAARSNYSDISFAVVGKLAS